MRSLVILFVAASLCLAANANSSNSSVLESATASAAYADNLKSVSEIQLRKSDPLNLRIDQFQQGRFPVGFYIYGMEDIEENLEEMARLGFTAVHLTNTDDLEKWENVLDICRRLKLSVLAQINTAYLTPRSEVSELVPRATAFIQKYKNDPVVQAFSVREEPSKALLPKLNDYYKEIYKEIPDAPIYLLHNYLGVMNLMKPPFPAMVGTDRYCFWWEFGPAGNRATPTSALRWFHTQLNAFYQDSLRQNGEFFAVFSPLAASEEPWSREKIKSFFYPEALADEERERLMKMVERLAEEGNQGWSGSEREMYQHWRYYAAPKNTIRAMCWLSVMEGAKSVYCYHWLREERATYRNGSTEFQMAPEQIQEFAEFARTIQRYGRLSRAMVKEFTPYKGSPLGHEVVEMEPLASPPVKFFGKNVEWRTFRLNGYEGRVVVAVNTDVGEWSEGRSPAVLTVDHKFRIGERGRLIDYTGYEALRTVKLSLPDKEMVALDLETGRVLNPGKDRIVEVSMAPGAGHFFFVCPADSSEMETLKEEFQL